MNASNFIHAGYALLMMAVVWGLTGDPLAGAMLGVGFFVGREHSQAEYKAIEKFYGGKRANLPNDFVGFMPRNWNLDSLLDVLFPTAAVLTVLLLAKFY